MLVSGTYAIEHLPVYYENMMQVKSVGLKVLLLRSAIGERYRIGEKIPKILILLRMVSK